METIERLAKDYLCAALDGFELFLKPEELEHDVRLRLSAIAPHIGYAKIGMELFNSAAGEFDVIKTVNSFGVKIFLDLKLFDIPETIKNTSRVLAGKTGVDIFNVHAKGEKAMMVAALEGADEASQKLGIPRPKIIGVTVLTSMNASEDDILKLALDVVDAGLDGIVCSALDLEYLKPELPDNFLFITPGIRLAGGNAGYQKRIASPDFAIDAGSSLLVVGRPIYENKSPNQQLNTVIELNKIIDYALFFDNF